MTLTRRAVERRLYGWMSAATVVALLAGCQSTPVRTTAEPSAPAKLTAEQRQLNVEAFDVVWNRVNTMHFDPDFGGLDWQAVRDVYRPRVASAETMDEARGLMNTALMKFGMSHFAVLPGELFRRTAAPAERDESGAARPETGTATARRETTTDDGEESDLEDGELGLILRVYDGEILVVDVLPESPAAEAGVKPGWLVTAVDGRSVRGLVERIEMLDDGGPGYQLTASRLATNRVTRRVGQRVRVTFRVGDDAEVEYELICAERQGTPTSFGYLENLRLRIETRRLAGDITYIGFNCFFDPPLLLSGVEQALKDCDPCAGIILDLRGNPGGIGGLAMGITSWLISGESKTLGTMRTRGFTLNFVAFPRPRAFLGPLAILVDECSASTAEVLAGGLQDLGRARIFGVRTAGAALLSVIESLPNGDRVQLPMADYVSAGGERLEGRGVLPDEEIRPTRAALLAGEDPVVTAAVAWLQAQSSAVAN